MLVDAFDVVVDGVGGDIEDLGDFAFAFAAFEQGECLAGAGGQFGAGGLFAHFREIKFRQLAAGKFQQGDFAIGEAFGFAPGPEDADADGHAVFGPAVHPAEAVVDIGTLVDALHVRAGIPDVVGHGLFACDGDGVAGGPGFVIDDGGGEGVSQGAFAEVADKGAAVGAVGPAGIHEQIKPGLAGDMMIADVGGERDLGLQEAAESFQGVAAPLAGIGAPF